jgi:hypothetical protein
VNGDNAYEGEMNDLILFERALQAAVPTQPDPEIARRLVPRLAEIAERANVEAETRVSRRWVPLRAGARPRSRRMLVARVGVAVAAVPLMLAGLAFAGVTLPGPARDAFDSVGISLPNQPAEHSKEAKGQSGGNDVSGAAKTLDPKLRLTGEGNSAAAHAHARQQRSKAQGEAKGHTRGKAVGLNELTPPGKSGDTGPPAHSNVGGSLRSQSVQSAPRENSNPSPPGNTRGHSKQANPGQSKPK